MKKGCTGWMTVWKNFCFVSPWQHGRHHGHSGVLPQRFVHVAFLVGRADALSVYLERLSQCQLLHHILHFHQDRTGYGKTFPA